MRVLNRADVGNKRRRPGLFDRTFFTHLVWGHHTGFILDVVGVAISMCVMARIARVVVPGMPHHVTQRGNRRQATFFVEGDYRAYLTLLKEWTGRYELRLWAYCLMPNHVHLIVVPPAEQALCRGVGETHRRYTRLVNFREGWRGHLWQGRFGSFVMDEPHLMAAARYLPLHIRCAFWQRFTQAA